jgi:hypothetical protein
MPTVTMALRAAGGLVLAADSPTKENAESPIRSLGSHSGLVIHDNLSFGDELVGSYLQGDPDLDRGIGAIADELSQSCRRYCENLAAQGHSIPNVGVIVGAVSEEGVALYGLYVGTRFEPRRFKGNLLGGNENVIARYLDSKLRRFGGRLDAVLLRAAIYLSESRSMGPAFSLDPWTVMATIDDSGFRYVSEDTAGALLLKADRYSERIGAGTRELVAAGFGEVER